MLAEESNVKVVDLDGRIIGVGGFGDGSFKVEFQIIDLEYGTIELVVYLQESGATIHLANYQKEDKLDVLIESLLLERAETEDAPRQAMYDKLIKRIVTM